MCVSKHMPDDAFAIYFLLTLLLFVKEKHVLVQFLRFRYIRRFKLLHETIVEKGNKYTCIIR